MATRYCHANGRASEIGARLVERNAGLPEDRRIQFRVGIHFGDVVEEADGDLMGDGVNIAARLEGICEPGEFRPFSLFCAQNRPSVSARKIPFPGPMRSRGRSRGRGHF